ncbi:hypothetical protein SAY87_002373 [Trapa incisa]|uniref:Uncharacterized protein n=1 Tax=Trapa incisa TaxID=236973 RepID=A0AAN7JUH6_9MYRT|nr:hypothetical protein SAY87_002373 [Trapa incisa]
MSGDNAYSPSGVGLSMSTSLNITTGGSQASDQLFGEGIGLDNNSNNVISNGDELLGINDDGQEDERGGAAVINDDHENYVSDGKEYPPPVISMEFDTYDDAIISTQRNLGLASG